MTEPDGRRSRASLLAWAPGEETREFAAARLVEDELAVELTARLVAESTTAGVAHFVLVLVVTALAWEVVPLEILLPWAGIVAAAGASRAVVARRMSAIGSSPQFTTRAIRRAVWAAGLGWASATVVIAPALPPQFLALLIVVFAGLLAGATVTLIGDPRSFYGLAGVLLVPLGLAVAVSGQSRFQIVALALIGAYATTMVVLFRRSHAALLQRLQIATRVAVREADAERDRTFLDALVNSAPDAIAAVSTEGRVLGVNPAFERLFGHETDEVLGEFLTDLLVPESDREAARELDQTVRRGRSMVVEVERLHRDGRLIPVRLSAASAGEEAHDAVLLVYDDLTAEKQIEHALREAEEQYRELVESASDLVWQTDGDGRWTFLNAACRRIYGVAPQDLLGKPFSEMVDPSHLEADMRAFRNVLEGGGSTDYETVHLDSSGRRRHLSVAALPVRDSHGEVAGARGIARDVSERVAARGALEQAREAAERTAEAKSAFLAATSHEIRTPMNGVLGMLELLLESELGSEERRLAELARSAAEALLTVINDVLDYSRIEAGQVQLDEVAFDLPALLSLVARLLAPGASESGVELACDAHPDVPRLVRGDPARLRQVITNLVGNAIKFTHDGEVVVSAVLESRRDDQAVVRFTVRDTGIGIAREKLEFVFQDFTQADVSTSRRYGGTGLGLPISRRLVRLMGGDLEASSTEGQGSEFTFTLAFPVEAQAPEVLSGDVGKLSGSRALIVDDNPTHRRIVREMLGAAQMEADEVTDADAALEALRGARAEGRAYALAIVDAYMPGKDGFDTAQEIRADPKLEETKIMMLTSAGVRGDAQRCRDLGIEAYLPKPPARDELLEAAAALLTGAGEPAASGRLITRYSIEEAGRRLHVLVAEDNPVNQEVAAAMLRRRGHTVRVVADGRAAVDAVRGGGVDVVLMDIEMPRLDGVSATEEIRSDPAFADVPIVAVTAHTSNEERERCRRAGMDRHVVKPFKPYELFSAVEGWGIAEEEDRKEPPRPPFDLAGLEEMMREAGAEEVIPRMLTVFGEDAPGRMTAIEEAADGGDPGAIRQAAHAYKSAALTIRAGLLGSLLGEMETAAREGDVAAAVELVGEVREAHEAVLRHLAARREAGAQ